MPLYQYRAADPESACAHCAGGFEVLQSLSDAPVSVCPGCGAAVVKVFAPAAVGRSQSGFDDRAQSAGFHKLKKLGKGEYEKQY